MTFIHAELCILNVRVFYYLKDSLCWKHDKWKTFLNVLCWCIGFASRHRQFQSTHTKSHRVIGGRRDKWSVCNFQEISTWLNTNRKLMTTRTKICHEAGRPSSRVCFLFAGQASGQDLCCQSKLLNYLTHRSDKGTATADGLTSYSLTTLMPRPPPP